MSLSEHIREQAQRVHRSPTEPQKSAGNYRKGHIRLHGLDIAIETPRGGFREKRDGDKVLWRARVPAHYGYIKRTTGADDDHVDVFVGPHVKSPIVYVVDQQHHDSGKFDEHKVMLGFASEKQARQAYVGAFSDGRGRDRIQNMTEMTVGQFRDWLRDGDTRKPLHRASGGRVPHMADGGAPPPFDPGRPWQSDQSDAPAFDEAKPFEPAPAPKASPAPATAGGWTDYIPDAIKDVPSEIWQAGKEQVDNIGGAWTRMRERRAAQAERDKNGAGFFDPAGIAAPLKDVGDTGGALMSGATVPFAPVIGAYRSLIGHPMADLEHAVGTVIAPDIAKNDDRAKMYEAAKHDADVAMSAARPRGFTAKGPVPVPESPLVTPEAQANRTLANEFDINLSRGQATQDLDRIRYEDMAARGAYGPEAQERAAAFFENQHQQVQDAGRGVGQRMGVGEQPLATPADAGASLNTEIAGRAAAARQMRDQVTQTAEQEAAAQRQMVDDRQRALTESIEGGRPSIETPRDAGEIVAQQLRDTAAAHRADFKSKYDEFGNLPGEFDVSAVRGMGNRVKNDLTFADNPVIIDEGTPAASRAIQALDEMSAPRITNHADPRAAPDPQEIAAVSLKGIDQMRKRLVGYYQQARGSGNASDARATRAVLNGFDNQIERAITENLFSGDPRALQALQEARSSYSRYQRAYTPNGAGDDVGTAMRRIIDRGATPEETANLVIGSGKIGTTGLPVRIADRLEQTLGANSEAWNAIRQAMWRKASQVRNTAGEIDQAKSAANVIDFTNSSLARRMFSPEERAAMRNHAQSVRDLEGVIESLPATRNAQRAQEIYQQAFGGEGLSGSQAQTFRRMVEGTATPEETAQTMFSVIAGGNPGNAQRAISAIEGIVGKDSPVMGAVRQGVWQKLTANPFGKDQLGQQKMVQSINEFLNGKGRGVARQLYSPEERALMNRYAEAVRRTIIPKYARTNSDTAVAWMAAARKYAGALGTALGVGTHGGVTGGLEGYAVGKLLDKVGEKVQSAANTKRLNDTLEDVIPAPRKGAPAPKARSAGRTVALAAHGGPDMNIGRVLQQLQGPVKAKAEDENKKP